MHLSAPSVLLLFGTIATASDLRDPELSYPAYEPDGSELIVPRSEYIDRLQGFWLGQCIANWTGLTTEMDRVEKPFYTDADWGEPDQKNVWGKLGPAERIDFVLVEEPEAWGADDDTDIEYVYQHLLDENDVSVLSPEQIRDGWLAHMWSDDFGKSGENFLWVSNESAFELMRDGTLPPDTSDPERNANYDMIDAQLTTEIFGLFAPGRPDVAWRMAELPIRTTAREDAQWASAFYVRMHSQAARLERGKPSKELILWLAAEARKELPDTSYVADMYDFVRAAYEANPETEDWEATRDAVYERYQLGGAAGYDYKQPFDAGINFAASLVSLFYGEGDLKRTLQIGTLAGWDSDNPTATWGGLLGFLMGREGVEAAFADEDLSELYRISRTRRGFEDRTPDKAGEDSFPKMAERGVLLVDRVVLEEMGGGVDLERDIWLIPSAD